jgi:hypothetical protein
MLDLHRLGFLVLPILVLLRCGGGTQPENDAGVDAAPKDGGKDAPFDSGKDAAKDAAADVVTDATTDSPDDGSTDASTDAADASDASVDAPADVAQNDGGTIAAISGLVLWLNAGVGVTTNNGSITAWSDQSSQGNDAAGGTSTATLASSSINSLPAAHFVGSNTQYLSIADATSLQFGTGDYYLAVVAKFDNSTTSQDPATAIGALYTKLGSSSGLLFFANDYDMSQQTFAAGLSNLEDPTTEVQYAASYNDGTARLYAVQRANGSEYLRVNGSQVASSSSSVDVSESGIEVDIGCMSSVDEAALDGDIAEIIAVKGTLSSSDRQDIESYLTSKYAL